MKILPTLILSLIFLVLWGCSDSGEPIGEPVIKGCMDSTACNYNIDATQDDTVCTYPETNYDCENNCIATADACGVCEGDGSTCNISYSATIQPIFNTNCTSCHGGSGGLTLTSYNDLMGSDIVDPGNSAASKLIQKLKGTASGSQMPKNQDPLNDTTINLIEGWIDEGAFDN